MALNFQDLPIPFVAGQTQTADDPLIQPPGVVRLANGEFDDRGNINVVDGVTSVAVTTMTGETAPSDSHPTLRRVHSWQGVPLIENFDGVFRQQVSGKFALAAGSNNRKRNSLRVRRAGVSSIAEAHGSQADDWNQNRRPSAGVLGVDAAVTGNYTCVVWCEEYGTATTFRQVSWLVRNVDGSVVGRGRIRQNGADVKEPRVVAFNSFFHIYGLTGGDLGYLRIDPTATQNVSETFTVIAAVGTYVWMDVALSPTQIGITCASATVVDTYVYNQNGGTPTFVGVAGIVAPGAPTPVANFYVNTGGAGVNTAFVAFYACAGTITTIRWFATNTAAVGLGVGAQSIAPVVIARPVAFKDWAGVKSNIPILLDTLTGGTVADVNIGLVRYDATSASPGSMASGANVAPVLQGHLCASLPVVAPSYTYSGSTDQGLLLGVQFSSIVQNTFQVFDIARSVTTALAGGSQSAEASIARVFDAGKFAAAHINPSGGALVGRVCSPINVPGESYGVHFWSAKFTPNITNVTDLGQNPTNIQRNTLRFDAALGSHEFANLLYFGGGTPLCYDGQDVFEEGFTYAPEVAVTVTTPGTGPLSAGSYALLLVYEWFDGQGNRWQSQCSNVATFTAAATNSYTLTARGLAGSLKSGVQAIPYRTAANGTIFYRDSPLGVTPLTDAQLITSELLYTSGVTNQLGTQSNNALPGVDTFATHQKRLVAVGGEYTQGFFYSKELSARFPAEFNRASGYGAIADNCGAARAAASLDDKLVLFGTESLAVVFGQGPNNLWLQNGYSPPTTLQATEGIREDTPFVAVVPEGVWYVTLLGPRLLDRSLSTALGADRLPLGHGAVNADKSIIGKCEAVLTHPSKAQVYFWQNTKSQVHIYDTTRDQWSYRGSDIYFRPNYHAASIGSRVYLVNDNSYNTAAVRYIDPANADSYTLTLETGWMTFAGLQRFQRFTHLQILATERETGVFASTYEFRLRVYADYNPTVAVQDSTLEVTPLNANSAPFMCEFQLHRQTDTAYKFIIDLRPPVSSKGGNFALVSMLARVGLKRGGAKLPAAQRG